MNKLLLLIGLFILNENLLSQPLNTTKIELHQSIDSLIQILKKASNDTNKVKTLIKLSLNLRQTGDSEQALKYADEALVLAKSLHFKNGLGWDKGVISAYNNIGTIYHYKGNYPEALKNYTEGLTISNRIGDKKEIANGYQNIGNASFVQGDYNEAMKQYKVSLKLREEIEDKKGMADLYSNIGTIMRNQGNYDEALTNYLAAMKIYEEIGDKKAVADGHNNLGIIYKEQGNYSEALKAYQSGLNISQEIGYQIGIAYSFGNIGNIYWYQGNYPEALKNQLSALKIREEIGDQQGLAACYSSIGTIFGNQGNNDDALKYFLIALKIQKELGVKKGMANSYANIGACYENFSNYPEALKNYFASLKLCEEMGDESGKAYQYNNIGRIYSNQGKYAEACQQFSASLIIQKEIGDVYGSAGSYISLGETYLDQGSYEDAILHLKKGLTIAKELNAKEFVKEAYSGLAMSFAGLNDYQKAYSFNQLFTTLKDTLLNEESNKQIAQLKEQYESEKKDAQIELLNKDKLLMAETNRNRAHARQMFISIGLLLIIVVFARYRLIHKLQVEKIRNRISQDLHDDIGSTLGSISIQSASVEFMKIEDYPEIISTVKHMGESTRSAMENMSDIVWAINPRNDSFKNMIDRIAIYGHKLLDARNIKLEIAIPETLEKIKLSIEQRKNIYLILRESIFNVAKYSEASHCLVTADVSNKNMQIQIKDDGIGFDKIATSLGGNGLLNMKQRADELKGNLEIQSGNQNGTSIALKFILN